MSEEELKRLTAENAQLRIALMRISTGGVQVLNLGTHEECRVAIKTMIGLARTALDPNSRPMSET